MSDDERAIKAGDIVWVPAKVLQTDGKAVSVTEVYNVYRLDQVHTTAPSDRPAVTGRTETGAADECHGYSDAYTKIMDLISLYAMSITRGSSGTEEHAAVAAELRKLTRRGSDTTPDKNRPEIASSQASGGDGADTAGEVEAIMRLVNKAIRHARNSPQLGDDDLLDFEASLRIRKTVNALVAQRDEARAELKWMNDQQDGDEDIETLLTALLCSRSGSITEMPTADLETALRLAHQTATACRAELDRGGRHECQVITAAPTKTMGGPLEGGPNLDDEQLAELDRIAGLVSLFGDDCSAGAVDAAAGDAQQADATDRVAHQRYREIRAIIARMIAHRDQAHARHTQCLAERDAALARIGLLNNLLNNVDALTIDRQGERLDGSLLIRVQSILAAITPGGQEPAIGPRYWERIAELEQQVERMWPVVEAAREWWLDREYDGVHGTAEDLAAAVRKYDETTDTTGRTDAREEDGRE